MFSGGEPVEAGWGYTAPEQLGGAPPPIAGGRAHFRRIVAGIELTNATDRYGAKVSELVADADVALLQVVDDALESFSITQEDVDVGGWAGANPLQAIVIFGDSLCLL